MPSPYSPKQNHLLAALPAADYSRLQPDLELMAMPLGWAVYEPGSQMGYVYFPTTSIISLLYVMENGSSAEIAIIGNEGLVGISLFMGGAKARRIGQWCNAQATATVSKRAFLKGSSHWEAHYSI